MTESADNPEILVAVPNELEAAVIISSLAAHGIRATALGGLTSGFKAEAPGEVRVLVGAADLERAREILRDVRGEQSDNDSSQLDAGAGE